MTTERDKALRRYAWLAQEVLRNNMFGLRDEQILRLATNPDVCIPPQMVGFMREEHLEDPTSRDFLRTDKGNLAFMLREDGGTSYFFRMDGQNGNLADREVPVPDDAEHELLGVVGHKDLWLLRPEHKAHACKLWLGDNLIAEKPCINNVTVLPDGKIIFTFTEGGDLARYTCAWDPRGKSIHGGSTEVTRTDHLRGTVKFVTSLDGTLRTIHGSGVYRSISPFPISWEACGGVVDLTYSEDRQVEFLVVDEDNTVRLYRFVQGNIRAKHMTIGAVPYVSSCLQFPDKNIWAYVGQAPNNQLCWVVNGEPHPTFRWVSEPFEHPEYGWCYWGIVGECLVTMRF
ncbi:MAG: hypothetical protein ABIH21_05155 [Patescibacteria group bacterium]